MGTSKQRSRKANRKQHQAQSGKERRLPLEALQEDTELSNAYRKLSEELAQAHALAERRAALRGADPALFLDLRGAATILDQHPQLVSYLESARERAASRQEQDLRDHYATTKASPTGYPSKGGRGDLSSLGGWAGVSNPNFSANSPVGIHNTRKLREWADNDEWVNSAVNYYAERVSHADIAVLPADERKPFNKNVAKAVELILDQPNEIRDSWPMLLGMFIRDLLSVGQGVLTKNMNLKRTPLALYCENAANLKTYPAWSGDPEEPRYLYQEGSGDWGISSGSVQAPVLLRNDEAIVVPFNPTTYRYGWGPVQVLADTIDSDLKATQAARHLIEFRSPPHLIDIQGASDQQIRMLRSAYETEVMGRREILFLGSPQGSKVSPLVFSAKDNQFLEWQEYLARKICAVFQISPQDLGITLDINKATAGSQQEISESKGYVPLLLLVEGYLNREFLSDFAPKLPMGRANLASLNLRIVFPEVSEAARQAHAAEAIALASESLAGLPSATLNQILAMRGEEPVPGGNTFWVETRANGLQPWLTYDGDFGNWVPLGSQDSGGGPTDDAAQDITANDQADDDPTGGSTGPTNGGASGTNDKGPEASGNDSSPGNAGSPATSTATTEAATTAPTGGTSAGAEKRFRPARRKAALARSSGWTGAMVGFFLDPETALQLAEPVAAALQPCCKPELPGDLHLTLAYFGDTTDGTWTPARVAEVSSTLALFAQQRAPLTGVVGGIGRFGAPPGQPTPLYASADVPLLPVFRQTLLATLASIGLYPSMLHGFVPHITLAYLDPDAAMPLESLPALPLQFKGITLAVGDARYTFPLAGPILTPTGTQATVSTGGKVPYTRQTDGRKPGTKWSPSYAQRSQLPAFRVSQELMLTDYTNNDLSWREILVAKRRETSGAHAHTDPQGEGTARQALGAALTRVFSEVVARGHQQAGKK